jgi:hypothetical protein
MYSKGISWIDDCRIPYVDTNEYQKRDAYKEQTIYGNGKGMPLVYWETNTKGRFPANLLVSDDMLNDGVINGGGSYSGIKTRKRNRHFAERGQNYGSAESPDNYGDKGSNSRYYDIDKWFEKLLND